MALIADSSSIVCPEESSRFTPNNSPDLAIENSTVRLPPMPDFAAIVG